MQIIKSNKSSLILLLSMLIGGIVGIALGERAIIFTPLANTFLNLLFVSIVPMIALSIISSITSMKSGKTLGKILLVMFIIFLLTGLFAGGYMLVFTKIFDPAKGTDLVFKDAFDPGEAKLDVLAMLTVDDFYKLLSKENLMALIVFSIITGLALISVRDEAGGLIRLVDQGMVLVNKIISYIMKFAPIGIGAYFASITGEQGSKLFGPLGRTIVIFFIAGFIYFFLVNTIMTFIARGREGVSIFWKNTWPPFITAFATSSSAAALPLNLTAGEKMGIREDVNNIVLPLGANLHKDGTVMIQIIKITLLCGILGIDLSFNSLIIAILVSYIAATVCGAVPGGGYTAEILLISSFGFPQATIPIMVLISTVVDSIATAINTTTDISAAMLVEKYVKES
ncbi:dicarboxylate/amino acid:cation symporter [uncultured Anaerococcus sp.]|uniref:dicarboxylate/amino acid:cation symporter n=1 Tax=uncultured Anaerococcus sp. TaxID=293428 RepID=UPI0025D98644|nr:dicarboxylate/amino acid:cation symporter [uncultured Anaerococcus sp.]